MDKKIKKTYLDYAAYLVLKGGILTSIEGQYGGSMYFIEIDDQVIKNIKEQPLVNYEKYMKKRKFLKDKEAKLHGVIKMRKEDFGKRKYFQR